MMSTTANVALTRRMAIANENVRQLQKLISIIDYDVCMTFYCNYSSILYYLRVI